MSQFCVVLVTCRNSAEAEKIGKELVEKRLAACVNVMPEIKSLFFWNKKLNEENEALLLVKTNRVLFSKLSASVKRHHSYEVPEIIALPIAAGEKHYLSWVRKGTKRS